MIIMHIGHGWTDVLLFLIVVILFPDGTVNIDVFILLIAERLIWILLPNSDVSMLMLLLLLLQRISDRLFRKSLLRIGVLIHMHLILIADVVAVIVIVVIVVVAVVAIVAAVIVVIVVFMAIGTTIEINRLTSRNDSAA